MEIDFCFSGWNIITIRSFGEFNEGRDELKLRKTFDMSNNLSRLNIFEEDKAITIPESWASSTIPATIAAFVGIRLVPVLHISIAMGADGRCFVSFEEFFNIINHENVIIEFSQGSNL